VYPSPLQKKELSFGADASAAGVVSLLQLARMFGKLYKDARSVGRYPFFFCLFPSCNNNSSSPAFPLTLCAKYNFLFVLTGGMPMEFSGLDRWLNEVDPRILRKIEIAVCLDGLSTGNTLYYHTKSGGVKNDAAIKMQQVERSKTFVFFFFG
jgi:hypothetical protein